MKLNCLILAVAFVFYSCQDKKRTDVTPLNKHQGMVWIKGGEFMLGNNSTNAANTESPAILTKVDGFLS